MAADIGGQKQLKKLKNAILKIKTEEKDFAVNEGLVQNILFFDSHMK